MNPTPDLALRLLERGQDMTSLIDLEGKFVWVNPAGYRLLGYDDHLALTGIRAGSLVHPDDQMIREEAFQAILKGEARNTQIRLRCSDGRYLFMEGTAVTAGEYILANFRDVTARVEAERGQRRTIDFLRQFAHVVAHDMASPVTTIAGFVSLLREKCWDQLQQDGREYLAMLETATKTAQRRLDGLLQLSQEQVPGASFESVDTNEILKQALDSLHQELVDSGATVVRHPLPAVVADPYRIERLFANLIANAIKFGARNIVISARVRPADTLFEISDDGQGIDPAYHTKIFMPFAQLDPDANGVGLGLAICRQIVERHNGQIWAESEGEGKGSQFLFSLPTGGDKQ